jgi:hypothetical protein
MYTVTSAARMSNGSLASEFVKRCRGALKTGLQAGRHVHVFLHFVDRRNGSPSAAFGARLNDTVMAGN